MLDTLDTLNFNDESWKYYDMLQSWDYFSEADLVAPTFFHMWWKFLYKNIWDEFDTISVAVRRPNAYNTLQLLKTQPNFELFDMMITPEKEDAKLLYDLTFEMTVDSISKMKEAEMDLQWYKFKNTSINHLLQLTPFSTTGIKIGGYVNTVNAAAQGHGPSWSMLVELTREGPKAWGVYPGSQTGNPGDPQYGHMIENWASGNYYSLVFGHDLTENPDVVYTQEFSPE
jgi:penicillin amidase